MRAKEFIIEGVLDFVKRTLGFTWGKAGDVVRGSVVAAYLEDHTLHSESRLAPIRNSKFKLINIGQAEAKQFRDFTDGNVGMDVIDADKMDRVQEYNITYNSLVQNPPVVDRDGFIWDGNHRTQRAIELKLPQIPVLKQI
jgi:hypothetical protein